VLVKSDRDHGRASVAYERVALLVVGEFQQLLTKVVAKGIGHELHDMRGSLVEDDLQVLHVALFQLLLQETTSMLVLAKAVDLVTRHGLQVVVHEAVSIVLKTTALDDASLAILNTTTRSISGVRVEQRNARGTKHAVCAVAGRATHLRTMSHGETVHSAVEHGHVVSIVRGVRARGGGILRHCGGADSACDAIDWRSCGHGRAKRSSTGVKARVAVAILLVLVPGCDLAAVAVVHGIVRNAAQVGIVVVQVLLSMRIEATAIGTVHAVHASAVVLEGWDITRGVGLSQLGHAVGGTGKAGALGLRAEVEFYRTTVVGWILARGSVDVSVGLAALVLVNLGSFAKRVSRQRLLRLTVTISLPTGGLGIRARGLGKGQIKGSGRGREFRTITSSVTANQDGEFVVRVAHLQVSLVVRRSNGVVLLVLFTKQIAGGVNVAQDRGQIRQIVAAAHIQASDGHGHAIIPLEISYNHCCVVMGVCDCVDEGGRLRREGVLATTSKRQG
jgi:hypothetical protein